MVVYPLLKLLTGRVRQVNAGMACLGILRLRYFLTGLVHQGPAGIRRRKRLGLIRAI